MKSVEVRFQRWLIAAITIHLVVVTGLLHFAPPPPPTRLASGPLVDIELDLEPTPVLSHPPAVSVAPDSATTGSDRPASHGSAKVRPGKALAAQGDKGGWEIGSGLDGHAAPGEAAPGPTASEGSAAHPPPGGVNLGLDRSMVWLFTNPGSTPSLPKDPRAVAGGLRDALKQHDRKLGLGFGGPVVSAAHAAASIPNAPPTGEALIEASFDSAGRVRTVNVLNVSFNARGWQLVATELRRRLRRRPLRVPKQKNGVAVAVSIKAQVRYPSGAPAGGAVTPKGLGAEFDASDIGAVPTRVVAVRIVGERYL